MNIAFQRKTYLCALTLLVAALCAAPAMAGDFAVYSNLGSGQSFNQFGGYFVEGSSLGNEVIADPFTPSTTANLADAVLALTHYSANNSAVNVYLESDNSGQPGAILDTLTQQGTLPSYGSTGPVTTFTCTTCPLVDAGTQYWIVALEPDTNSQQMWNFETSDNSGLVAYNYSGSATGPWVPGNFNISAFQVDGSTTTTTPEPGSMLLMATSLMALGPIVRKKLW